MAGLRLISTAGLLHCDKVSWLCHIEAPTVRFGVQALMVLGDNGWAPPQQLMKLSITHYHAPKGQLGE
jgi:hypothetical protein